MPDTANPYIPGQSVDNPKLFVGRREILASIHDHLVKGWRAFIVSGAERMGKTSLLKQLPAHLPEGFVAVRVELLEENAAGLDWLMWRIAAAMSAAIAAAIDQQMGDQLEMVGLEADWADFEGRSGFFLEQFWPQVRATLGDRCLVLMLDDLDSLSQVEGDLAGGLVATMSRWRAQDDGIAFILATGVAQYAALERQHRELFGGALTFQLGPLSSEEATRLIAWPVEGIITYDYGVARRMIEITSGQPYYLQLLCFEVFNRCAQAGWVNQRDVDLVMEDLVGREIADFREFWDESSPSEQAVLAGLVSLRGSRGVPTVQDVLTLLNKAGARAERDQVVVALDNLADRGILERLGAHSYRFRVALLRDWLGERIDFDQVVRDTRWDAPDGDRPAGERLPRLRTRKERRRTPSQARPRAVEDGEGGGQEDRVRSRSWRWLGPAAVLAVVLLVALRFTVFKPSAEPTPVTTPIPTLTVRLATVTLTVLSTTEAQLEVVASPTEVPAPLPTATPSPTPPVVVARPVPSIAYQAQAVGEQRWSIYVMNSDGSNRTRLTDGSFEAFSPVWSPDGGRIAYVSDRDGSLDIWAMASDGSNPVNLTQNEAQDRWPAWSPDGEWIAFASVRDVLYWELYVMRADGSDIQRLTWWDDASDWTPAWSPDGTRLAFASKRDGNWEIYTMDRDGSNLVRLTDDPADDTKPAWSPDGSRIAFESMRGGYTDIFVIPIVGGEAVNLTNLSWATDLGPTWSPDGGRIAFYSDRDGGWDIYVMASDGSGVVKLTGDGNIDQVPAWRP